MQQQPACRGIEGEKRGRAQTLGAIERTSGSSARQLRALATHHPGGRSRHGRGRQFLHLGRNLRRPAGREDGPGQRGLPSRHHLLPDGRTCVTWVHVAPIQGELEIVRVAIGGGLLPAALEQGPRPGRLAGSHRRERGQPAVPTETV